MERDKAGVGDRMTVYGLGKMEVVWTNGTETFTEHPFALNHVEPNYLFLLNAEKKPYKLIPHTSVVQISFSEQELK